MSSICPGFRLEGKREKKKKKKKKKKKEREKGSYLFPEVSSSLFLADIRSGRLGEGGGKKKRNRKYTLASLIRSYFVSLQLYTRLERHNTRPKRKRREKEKKKEVITVEYRGGQRVQFPIPSCYLFGLTRLGEGGEDNKKDRREERRRKEKRKKKKKKTPRKKKGKKKNTKKKENNKKKKKETEEEKKKKKKRPAIGMVCGGQLPFLTFLAAGETSGRKRKKEKKEEKGGGESTARAEYSISWKHRSSSSHSHAPLHLWRPSADRDEEVERGGEKERGVEGHEKQSVLSTNQHYAHLLHQSRLCRSPFEIAERLLRKKKRGREEKRKRGGKRGKKNSKGLRQ